MSTFINAWFSLNKDKYNWKSYVVLPNWRKSLCQFYLVSLETMTMEFW